MSTKTKSKPAKTLPDNLPDLIELAVRDARACAKDPRYALAMGVWHMPNGKCSVCMAGAVMAKTLRFPRSGYAEPWDVSDGDERKKLFAINCVRAGYCEDAAAYLGVPVPRGRTVAASSLILRAYDLVLGRAPWRVYLKAARIIREGARVEALESREASR